MAPALVAAEREGAGCGVQGRIQEIAGGPADIPFFSSSGQQGLMESQLPEGTISILSFLYIH